MGASSARISSKKFGTRGSASLPAGDAFACDGRVERTDLVQEIWDARKRVPTSGRRLRLRWARRAHGSRPRNLGRAEARPYQRATPSPAMGASSARISSKKFGTRGSASLPAGDAFAGDGRVERT